MSVQLPGRGRGEDPGALKRTAWRELREYGRARLLPEPEDRLLFEIVEARALRPGDVVLVLADDVVPADGEILEGAGRLDESALAGPGEPVLRGIVAGGEVAAGSRLLSGWLVLRVSAPPDRCRLALAEGAAD